MHVVIAQKTTQPEQLPPSKSVSYIDLTSGNTRLDFIIAVIFGEDRKLRSYSL
jgi:hypothetical protein